MKQQTKRSLKCLAVATVSAILLSGCIVHVGGSKANARVSYDDDYSSVNKSLTIQASESIGDASTVNGSLTLENNVRAEEVSSVNGRVSIGNNVRLEEISSVNGNIKVGSGFLATDDVSTVNGSITLRNNSEVKGSVSSVNGDMEIDGVDIHGDIETVNGSVALAGETRVRGDIVFKRRNENNTYLKRNPVLKIESGVRVSGDIILESPVDLEFADESLRSKVREQF